MPAQDVAVQLDFGAGAGLLPFAPREAGVNVPPAEFLAEEPLVVGFIGHHFSGSGLGLSPWLRDLNRGEGILYERDLRLVRRRFEQAQRKTLPGGDEHQFRAFTSLGEPDFSATFWPKRSTRPGTPGSTPEGHPASAARPVATARYARSFPIRPLGPTGRVVSNRSRDCHPRSGRSCQRSALCSTKRMPFRVVRPSDRGRPVALGGGSNGARRFHWVSVRSVDLQIGRYSLAGPSVDNAGWSRY